MSATRPIAAPNLPVAPNEYQQRYHDQLNNILRLYHNTVATAVNASYPFGSFYSTVTQTNPVANTRNLITVNSTVYTNQINLGGATSAVTPPSYSRIYIGATGVYNIQFSVQADKTGGGADSMYIWLRVNGVDVPNSASKVVISGPNAETIPAWNFMIILQEGDYFELAWSSADTNMVLAAVAAAAPVPSIPSVIITVTWVSNIP
jgi:hypothetical protein